jgi:hypothetical protein
MSDTTKPCKCCKEPIDVAATKCPKCQGFQNWYRNPQMFPLVFVVPLIAFLMWDMSRLTRSAAFADYKDKLNVTVVDENGSANPKLVTVRLENRSDKTWKRPKFQVENLDAEGKVISVEHVNEFNVVVAPNSSILDTLSLRITPAETIAKRRVTLTDIDRIDIRAETQRLSAFQSSRAECQS